MARAREWKVQEVFEQRRAKEYALKLDALWHEILIVQDSVYVLEKVIDFPADLLLGPEQHRFLDLVKRNFIREAVLGIIDLLSDRHPRLMTLPTLKAWILKTCRPEVQRRLTENLDRVAAPGRIQKLREQALRFHLDVQSQMDLALDPRVKSDLSASFRELSAMLKDVRILCARLCLEHDPGLRSIPYSALIRRPSRLDLPTDIENILHRVARSSAVLRMPEENPERWAQYRRQFSAADGKAFNLWRSRIGRPEVEF